MCSQESITEKGQERLSRNYFHGLSKITGERCFSVCCIITAWLTFAGTARGKAFKAKEDCEKEHCGDVQAPGPRRIYTFLQKLKGWVVYGSILTQLWRKASLRAGNRGMFGDGSVCGSWEAQLARRKHKAKEDPKQRKAGKMKIQKSLSINFLSHLGDAKKFIYTSNSRQTWLPSTVRLSAGLTDCKHMNLSFLWRPGVHLS